LILYCGANLRHLAALAQAANDKAARAAQPRVIDCRITGFRSRARARYGTKITAFRQIDMAKVDESDVDCDFLRNGGQRVWAGAGSPSALGSGSFRLLVRCRFEPQFP